MKEFRGKPVASSKKEAMTLGYSFYWTGKPCPKGHIAPRLKAGGCVDCFGVLIPRDQWKPRKPPPQDPGRHIKNFWSKVEKTGTCWLWKGLLDKDGYGKWGKARRTHQFSYELTNGAIPDGMHVCHSCDVRNCVNPEHLWLGTNAENMDDRNKKKRQAARHRIRASISVEMAIDAYRDMMAGMLQRVAAEKYGVSEAMACMLANAKTWHFRVEP